MAVTTEQVAEVVEKVQELLKDVPPAARRKVLDGLVAIHREWGQPEVMAALLALLQEKPQS